MLARMQKSLKEKDQGFTLIELLVVIVIIGILAAIAIPIFLNQQKKGVDAGLKSDLKNAATAIETYKVDNPTAAIADDTATTTTDGAGALKGVKVSDGNTIKVTKSTATGGGYCLFAYNSAASEATSATSVMIYDAQKGGLQKTVGAPTCP